MCCNNAWRQHWDRLFDEELSHAIGMDTHTHTHTHTHIHLNSISTAFLSSIDMHTQLGFQLALSCSIAIVYSDKDKQKQYLRLMQTCVRVLKDYRLQGHHKHQQSSDSLYEHHSNYALCSYATKFHDWKCQTLFKQW